MEHDDQVGNWCTTCGLSDVGRERLLSFGFTVKPCIRCVDYFGANEGSVDCEEQKEVLPAPLVTVGELAEHNGGARHG